MDDNNDDVRRVLLAVSGLDIQLRHDGIVVFDFHNFARTTIQHYLDYIDSVFPYIKPDARNLFDLRNAGLPSQYLWDTIRNLYGDKDFPSTIRTVLLFESGPRAGILRMLFERQVGNIGQIRIMTHLRDAIAWLNENHLPPE